MLPANVISALQILSRSDKPLIGATTDIQSPATKLEPGLQLQATVQSKISEGVFKVQVAGQTLKMRLPANIQSGDKIRLEVISTQPRITFSMVASTIPLSTPEQIGATARILSELAEQPLERPMVQQLGSKAIWQAEGQAPEAGLLAGALRDALGKSGLFYESHQAQWVRGERSTNQLLEEPQNILAGKNPLISPSGNQAASTDSGQAASPGSGQASPDKPFTARMPSDSPSMARSAENSALPTNRELLHLVQQQLHTLEHHHLVWMGQVWPGQQMQWEIQGEPEHRPRQQSENQWSTEIELALPKLGDVRARLVFAESGLCLTLHAADLATVDAFKRALPDLEKSLGDANIVLTAVTVEKT